MDRERLLLQPQVVMVVVSFLAARRRHDGGAKPTHPEAAVSGTHSGVPESAARVCDYLTSERRRDSSPMTRGRTIQIIVVEPSIAHSLTVFVAPSRSATCV
jgi:hypothetical protein